jgi:hypothetical protein
MKIIDLLNYRLSILYDIVQYSYGKKSIDTFLNKIKETFGENILHHP